MKITVLGSTGSIGVSTLDVISHANSLHPGSFDVDTLIAGSNAEMLAKQAIAVNAKHAIVSDPGQYQTLQANLAGTNISCAAGLDAVLDGAARPVDRCMAAISGTAGLRPTLAALEAGNTILLANKETMVCAGPIILAKAKALGVEIIPVDSEHNAIFQVLDQSYAVERMTLTASGGPFRTTPLKEMRAATPAMALNHPNWSMGAKNSLDSATMMNKGLELIEAAYLFELPEDRIDVLIHPQSIIHSLVAYKDGSVLAQMGDPDMRTPISYALGWPNRVETTVKRLDLAALSRLDFEEPDTERFPALELARAASREGPLGTCVYNAANEAAGLLFLDSKCGFLDIAKHVRLAMDWALDSTNPEMPPSITSTDDVLHVTKRVSDHVSTSLLGL